MDADLQMMKRSRTECIHGFTYDQEHSLQMASGSSWIKVTNVWKS